jgi:glycosyltransferase involved in cell wall biosynthesis
VDEGVLDAVDPDHLGQSSPERCDDLMSDRLRVALLVAGLPTPEDPHRGIFNVRALHALSSLADVRVLFARAWVPGRPRRERDPANPNVLTVTAPQIPERFFAGAGLSAAANIVLYRAFGGGAARELIENSDIVHSVDAVLGMIASSWAAKASKCHVTQLIGSDVNIIIPRLPAPIARGWTRGLHGVISNSNQLAKRFSAIYPWVPNVRTVPRGVNPELFDSAGVRLGPQADERPVRFAFFGGFKKQALQPEYVKGGPTLLRAWKEVEANLASSGASLLIAGPGSSGDLVRRWHATLRYPERVHVVGQVLPAEMAGHLRAADAVLVPSFEEGLPNVCMEAGACGRAVFGSAVGGIPDVIVHGETGLVIPAGDVRAWSDALVSYARQGESLREMGQRARARVQQCFDSRDYGARVLTVYEAALKSQSSGRRLTSSLVSSSPTRAPAKPTR